MLGGILVLYMIYQLDMMIECYVRGNRTSPPRRRRQRSCGCFLDFEIGVIWYTELSHLEGWEISTSTVHVQSVHPSRPFSCADAITRKNSWSRYLGEFSWGDCILMVRVRDLWLFWVQGPSCCKHKKIAGLLNWSRMAACQVHHAYWKFFFLANWMHSYLGYVIVFASEMWGKVVKTVQSQDDSCARPTRVLLCPCHMRCCKKFTRNCMCVIILLYFARWWYDEPYSQF